MDEEYFLIDQSPNIDNEIVSIITRIFQEGEIEVLIGTKSLLGEGWDAPAINSLILASFVGSFVLSNQMRGRAIRTQNGNKNKTGNIWHLVCVDPTSKNGGEDYELLFTVCPQDSEKVKFIPDLNYIGEIKDASFGVMLKGNTGNLHALKAQGWTHF